MDIDDDDSGGLSPDQGAPTYNIPTERVVSVEHPCIIRNFEKGLKSLGGEPQLKHVLEYRVGDGQLSDKHNVHPEPVAGVSLRPDDPFAKRLSSTGIETRNILFRVTLPKRTGRKRKRGSDVPYTASGDSDAQNTNVTAPQLLQRLRDNEERYSLEPIAMLRETHRFRTLPDFQLRAAELPMMRNIRKHAMIPEYDRIKNFMVDLSPNAAQATSFPAPPNFTSADVAQRYEYQQAAGIIVVEDEHGRAISRNLAAAHKRFTWDLLPDVPQVPQAHPPDLRWPVHVDDKQLRSAIADLKKLLEERPLMTKRFALNALSPMTMTIFKEAMPWVGYSFKAGPWRDSLIAYGTDPRSDPKYRIYQTLMFKMDKEGHRVPPDTSQTRRARSARQTHDESGTHIFDGKSITANGKTWQICDITDPVVAELMATSELQEKCDVYQWGWYHNGTMAKARVIMRDKMRFLFAGKTPPEGDYRAIARLPNELHQGNMEDAMLPLRSHGERLAVLSNEMRSIAKTGETLRKLKIGKLAGESAIGQGAEDEEEIGDMANAGELDLGEGVNDDDDDDEQEEEDDDEEGQNSDEAEEAEDGDGDEDEDDMNDNDEEQEPHDLGETDHPSDVQDEEDVEEGAGDEDADSESDDAQGD